MKAVKPRKVHFFKDNSGKVFKSGKPNQANAFCEAYLLPEKLVLTKVVAAVTCSACLRKMKNAGIIDRKPLTTHSPQIRVTAMPSDTNPYGGVFGGWLMAQMALGAGSLASRVGQGKAVVVHATDFTFPGAMAVGDELSVYCEIIATGTTSLTIAAEAEARERNGEAVQTVARGTFKFVLIGEDGRPRKLDTSTRPRSHERR
jgi:acyl-CoA thioesterase YciA